jgi:pyridoxamine 5'-phosphate oxidase
MNLESIRIEYTRGALDISNIGNDPFIFFGKWLDEAIYTGIADPTAMSVSTIGQDGFPQSRIVLLKSFDNLGFIFFTNYTSQKGKSIEQHPGASLLFFWPELQRQVRITGEVNKVSREITESYFSSRPRSSQIGAWASAQSEEIPSREHLEKLFEDIEEKYRDTDIPAPAHWGGYILKPLRFEFWQGRESRMHDRFSFEKTDSGWHIRRLAP